MVKKFLTLLGCFILIFNSLSAQINLTTCGANNTQSFNTLPGTFPTPPATCGGSFPWLNNSTIRGWYVDAPGAVYRTGDNTCAAFGVYRYRNGGDLFLGGIAGGTVGTVRYGANYRNNTGGSVNQINISYQAEALRRATATNTLRVEYSRNATSLTTGTWTTVPSLTFTIPGGAAGAFNPVQQSTLTATVNLGNVIPNGAGFWIRWTDDAETTNAAMAIDDVSVNVDTRTLGAITGPAQVCNNEPPLAPPRNKNYELPAMGNVNFEWSVFPHPPLPPSPPPVFIDGNTGPAVYVNWYLALPGTYRLRASTTGLCRNRLTEYTVTVNAPPVYGTLTGETTVCTGTNTGLITANGFSGGTIVRWESAEETDPGFNTPTPIASSANPYRYNNLTRTLLFRPIYSNGICDAGPTPSVKITVNNQLSVGGTVSASNTILCAPNNSESLTLTGQIGNVIRWEVSADPNFLTGITSIANINTILFLNNLNVTGTTYYRAVVRNLTCAPDFSSSVQIRVISETQAGTLSADRTICAGTRPPNLNLTGSVGGTNEWDESFNDPLFTNPRLAIARGTNTFNPGVLTNPGTYYYRVNTPGLDINNTCGGILRSNVVKITVADPSVGGTISPNAVTLCTPNNNQLLTLSGKTGNVIRWEVSADPNFLSGITSIANTNVTFILNNLNLTSTTYYRAAVQNGPCAPAFSASVEVVVSPGPQAGTLTADRTICAGTAPLIPLQLSGGAGGVNEWDESFNDPIFTNPRLAIARGTNAFNPGVLNNPGIYYYRVNTPGLNGNCGIVRSNVVSITVIPATVAGTVSPNDVTLCTPNNNQLLTLTGQTGNVVRWEVSADPNFLSGITSLANTNTIFVLNNLNVMGTTYYRAAVRNGTCATAFSSSAKITVSPGTVAGTLSADQTVCAGTAPAVMNLTGSVGGTNRWDESFNDPLFTNPRTAIAQGTNSFTPGVLNNAGTYYYRVNTPGFNNNVCGIGTSNVVKITVIPATVPGAVSPNAVTLCTPNNNQLLTLTGQTGNVIRWEVSADPNFLSGVTSLANTTGVFILNNLNVTGTTYYRAVVRNGTCATAFSAAAQVTVSPGTQAGILSADQTVCAGETPSALNLAGSLGGTNEWDESFNDPSFINNVRIAVVSGVFTYTPEPKTVPGVYYYRVYTPGLNGNCGTRFSNTVKITINPQPVAGVLGTAQTLCGTGAGNNLTLTGHSGNILHWESSIDGFQSFNIINNTTNTLNFGVLSRTTRFRVRVSTPGCNVVVSNQVEITVNQSVFAGTLTSEANSGGGCNTNNGIIRIFGNSGSIVRWEFSYDNASWSPIAGNATSLSYNISFPTYFRAVVAVPGCNGVAFTAPLYLQPGGMNLTVNHSVGCIGRAKVVAVASGGRPPYRYFISPPAGTQTRPGIFENVPAGTYSLSVLDENNCLVQQLNYNIVLSLTPPIITGVQFLQNNNNNGTQTWGILWESVAGAAEYQIQLTDGISTITASTGLNPSYVANNLAPGIYRVQVRVRCSVFSPWSAWSPVRSFTVGNQFKEGAGQALEKTAASKIEIYPNPTNGLLNLKFSEADFRSTNVTVTDLSGKIVYQTEVNTTESQLDLSHLTKGMYLLRAGNREHHKIILE